MCTTQTLIVLRNKHKYIVKDSKKEDQLTLLNYIDNIQKVISTLWLNRSAERSYFFSNSLIKISQICISLLTAHYQISSVMSAAVTFLKMIEKCWIESSEGFKRNPLKWYVRQWISYVQKMRILSFWPFLEMCIMRKTWNKLSQRFRIINEQKQHQINYISCKVQSSLSIKCWWWCLRSERTLLRLQQ